MSFFSCPSPDVDLGMLFRTGALQKWNLHMMNISKFLLILLAFYTLYAYSVHDTLSVYVKTVD